MFSAARRFAGGVFILVVVGSALGACSSGSGGGSSGPVTINMWARQGDNVIKDQLAAFETSHPDIKVNLSIIDGSQYISKLAIAIRAGTVPDLMKFDVVNAAIFQAQHELLDITDKAKALPDFSSLAQAGIDNGTLDGKIYSLPAALSGSQMFWNKSLFSKAGLDPSKPPTTLAEVMTDARKIQALGGGVSGFSTLGGGLDAWTGFPSVWADGGDVFTAIGPQQKATFLDPHVIAALEWYQSMWHAGLMPKTDAPNGDPGNVGAQNAASGKVGIIFQGAFIVAGHESEFGSAPGIPGMNGSYASFLGGDSAGIPIGATQHLAQAWTLMNWLITSNEAAQIDLKDGWVAPDISIAKQIATSDFAKTTAAALGNGKLPESIAFNATVNTPDSPYSQAELAVVYSGANAQEQMSAATDKANQIIQQAYQQVQ